MLPSVRLRAWAALPAVLLLLLLPSAAPAASLQPAVFSSDPTEDESVSVSVTVAGESEARRGLYVFRHAGDRPCGATAAAEYEAGGQSFIGGYLTGELVGPGGFTRDYSFTPPGPATYRICAYVAEGAYAAALASRADDVEVRSVAPPAGPPAPAPAPTSPTPTTEDPDGAAVVLLRPADGSTVEVARPTLEWSVRDDLWTRDVLLFDRPPGPGVSPIWSASGDDDDGELYSATEVRSPRLAPRRYFWQVFVEDGDEEVTRSSVSSFTVVAPPLRGPQLLAPSTDSTIEGSRVDLRWRLGGLAETREVRLFTRPPGEDVKPKLLLSEEIELSGLEAVSVFDLPPGRYFWQVDGRSDAGFVYSSDIRSFRLVAPRLRRLRVSAGIRGRRAVFSIRSVEGARVSLRILRGGRRVADRRFAGQDGPLRRSFGVSCLRPGTLRYRVSAVDSYGTRRSRSGRLRVQPCRMTFPSRCTTPRYRPRSIIVACGDGNFQLRRLRWRGWNRRVARGRGVGLVNDCIPYCAEGHLHRLPVAVTLSRRRFCGNVGRYVYTRLSYRYLRPLPGVVTRPGRVPFGCGFYDIG